MFSSETPTGPRRMDTLYSVMHSVGAGLISSTVDSVSRSLSREVSVGLRPRGDVDRSAVNLPNFVKFVAAVDMDAVERPAVHEKLREIRDRGVRCTLETALSMAPGRAQPNPMEHVSIGPDSLVFVVSPPQAAKSATIEFATWRTGVEHGLPTVLSTLARKGEGDRWREGVDRFNERLSLYADVFGIPRAQVPSLRLFDVDRRGDDARFGAACKRRDDSDDVPICVFMGNSRGAAKARALVENHVSKNVGRDREDVVDSEGRTVNGGRALVQLVVDEADSFVQPGRTVRGVHQPGALEEALNTEVGLSTESRVGDRVSITRFMRSSLFEAFTSVALVTATIYAFLGTEEPFVVRTNRDVVFVTPSSNYWSLMTMDGWSCKEIENMVVGSHDPMLRHMMESSTGPRHGLVAKTSKESGTRVKTSQDYLALDAAKRFPDMLCMAWNGDGIKIFTANTVWKEIIGGTGAFDRAAVPGGHLIASDPRVVVESFASKREHSNRAEWVGGGVRAAHIHSYRGVVDLIYERAREGVPVPHTALFSLNMAARGTPIKGHSHRGELTDMFMDTGSTGHDENMIQLAGRLFGIDRRTQEQGKIIWGPRSTLSQLYDGFKSMTFFVAKLKDDVSLLERKREVLREVYESVSGAVRDTHQVTNKSMQKRSRRGNDRRAVEVERELKRVARERRVVVRRTPFVDGFRDVPLRAHVVPVAAAPAPAPAPALAPAPADVARDASRAEDMDELWEGNKAPIVGALRAVVDRHGDEVPISTVARDLPGEDGTPGFDFSPTTFLRRICDTTDVLARATLVFRDDKFSAAPAHMERDGTLDQIGVKHEKIGRILGVQQDDDGSVNQ